MFKWDKWMSLGMIAPKNLFIHMSRMQIWGVRQDGGLQTLSKMSAHTASQQKSDSCKNPGVIVETSYTNIVTTLFSKIL